MIEKNHRITQKWSPIIDNIFREIKYMIPYIRDDVAYQLELKSYNESVGIFLEDRDVSNVAVFADNIKTYLTETIPNYYIENVDVSVNPFNGDMLFKHNGKCDHGSKFQPDWTKFVSLKEYRKLKLDTINEGS